MKMHDMSENYEKLQAAPTSQQPYYPSFTVTDKQLPQAKNWKIGKSYKVMMEVKMVGMELKRNRFEMHKIGVANGG